MCSFMDSKSVLPRQTFPRLWQCLGRLQCYLCALFKKRSVLGTRTVIWLWSSFSSRWKVGLSRLYLCLDQGMYLSWPLSASLQVYQLHKTWLLSKSQVWFSERNEGSRYKNFHCWGEAKVVTSTTHINTDSLNKFLSGKWCVKEFIHIW